MKHNLLFFVILWCNTTTISCMNFVLISAPGSGKGSFSQYFIERYNYFQICPGDIFRKEIREETELGLQIKPIVESGQYVEETIVCNLIGYYLHELIRSKRPFIIDGFPRSQVSLNFLLELLREKNLLDTTTFLQFTCSDKICMQRIIGRLICQECNKVYHCKYNKPIRENICDSCNIQLIKRTADTQEIAKQRLAYFNKNIKPLLNNINKNKIKKIYTEKRIKLLHKEYDRLLGNEQ